MRERQVLVRMVMVGTAIADDPPVTVKDRVRWIEQVAGVRAGQRCGCGVCPSIDLEHEEGASGIRELAAREPAGASLVGGRRVVLTAVSPGAMILLFVDDDRLSYLELAPLDDEVVTVFPPTIVIKA